MSETDYNARLYEKMKAEQDKYRDWLLHQEPSEILNHTYEYTMREDIVMCIRSSEIEKPSIWIPSGTPSKRRRMHLRHSPAEQCGKRERLWNAGRASGASVCL